MALGISPQAARLEEALLSLDRAGVAKILSPYRERAAADRIELADSVIAPALSNIGSAWDEGTVALSQVYMAGRIVEDVLGRLPPAPPRPAAPTVGIAVLEDHHALGKRIISAVLASAGFDVRDLGCGATASTIVDRVQEHRVDILMVSVLMLHRALHVSDIRDQLRERGIEQVMLVVGGAPFIQDPTLWSGVGADAWGRNAADALRIAASVEGSVR